MKEASRRPLGIDLFSGAGGLSLGFEQAGFDVVAAVEIDPIHCATHKFNFPDTETICASVKDLTGEQIRKRSKTEGAEIDVVFGGAPCQGFSMIGKRALDDPRNSLVSHFVRLVKEIQPRYFVFENVRGLTQGDQIKFLDELVENLEAAGYRTPPVYTVYNAANYGVPQSRQRLLLVGSRLDVKMPITPEPQDTIVTVGEAIGDLPNADDYAELIDNDSIALRWETKSSYARILRGLEQDPTDFSYTRKYNPNVLTSSLRTFHTEDSKRRFHATEPGKTETISRFRKLELDGLCNTLRAGTDSARGAHTSARPIHPIYDRVITVREAARLHSYPDWFRLHATKWHGFRQVGNSVPPRLGRAVASEIVNALSITPTKPVTSIELGDSQLVQMNMSEASTHFGIVGDVIAKRKRVFDLEVA